MLPRRIIANCRSVLLSAWVIVSVLSLAACGGGTDTRSAAFSGIGFLPGYSASQATAVSADGSVVVGTATTAAGNTQAFRWAASQGMTGLGFLPGGSRSIAAGVSADGNVIVGSADATSAPATPTSAFRWVAASGMSRVEPISGSNLCSASGVSGDGQIVIGTCLTINNEAFRWTAATGSVGLGRFGGGSNQTSTGTAISSNGMVIVGAGHPMLTGAVSWLAGGSEVLGKLPGHDSATASAVSRDGAVIVGTSFDSSQVPRAFRWTRQTGVTALVSTSGAIVGSNAAAVSGDGSTIVGWASTSIGGETAVIWDAERGMRLLDIALTFEFQAELKGWNLTRATAISDDGRTIAGYGINPSGQTEGWIVKLPV